MTEFHDERRDDGGDRPRTAAEWYVALDARTRPSADESGHAVDASFAEWLTRSSVHELALERCETAVTLAQALADDPDLALAYAEAGALAARPRASTARARPARFAWTIWAGLTAVAAAIVVAIGAPSHSASTAPIPRAVATAAEIVAGEPPLNGAVVLPGDYVVHARTLAVLPFTVRDPVAASARAASFAAALEGELVTALRDVPGIYVISAEPVPAGAGDELATSQIGALIGARGIVVGSVYDTAAGIEVEIALLDAATDTLLWQHRYGAQRAAPPVAAAALVQIAAALVASPDSTDPVRARGENTLASFGTRAEGADE